MEGNVGDLSLLDLQLLRQGLDLFAPPDLCYNYRGCIGKFR